MNIKTIASIIFLVASLSWGCQSGSTAEKENKGAEKDQKKVQAKTPAKQQNASGEVDKHGRKPGEAHYGHDHGAEGHGAPATNTQTGTPAGTTTGGPDKFGRNPGDEHYGHGHP